MRRSPLRAFGSRHAVSGLAVVVLAMATSFLAGCRSYERRPLDLTEHREAWHARTPADEPIRAFAKRWAEAGDDTAGRFDPDDGLDLAEAELVALVFNPDLRMARLQAGVARATAEHAGLWPDPNFSTDVMRIADSASGRWFVSPGLSFTLPVSGRLAVERSRAEASERAALDRVAEQEWDVRRDLRMAWHHWSAARVRVDETERRLTAMRSLVAAMDRLADAGEMLATEATLFALEELDLREELHLARTDADVSELRLRSLMGLSAEAELVLRPSLATLESVDGDVREAPREEALASHPSLVRLRGEYEAAELVLKREIREQYPDVRIGPRYELDEGRNRYGLLFGLVFPLWNRNAQGVAQAEASREVARARYETEYEHLAGMLASARVRAESFREHREHILDRLAPLVERQVADARRLLELGEGSALVLLESLSRAYEAKMHLVETRLGEAIAWAELAYLAGPEPESTATELDAEAASAEAEGEEMP